jgi:hypothetical protein
MYAALRAIPVSAEPVARLWPAATLLREPRGDCHIAALPARRVALDVPAVTVDAEKRGCMGTRRG